MDIINDFVVLLEYDHIDNKLKIWCCVVINVGFYEKG